MLENKLFSITDMSCPVIGTKDDHQYLGPDPKGVEARRSSLNALNV